MLPVEEMREGLFSFLSVEDESKTVSSGSGGGAVQSQDCHFSQYFIQSQGETPGIIALLIGRSLILWPLIGQGSVVHLYH